MRETLSYTLLRLVLFVAAFGLLRLAGARSLLLWALSILISGIASYFLLNGPRIAMSAAISRKVSHFRQRLHAATSAEDQD